MHEKLRRPRDHRGQPSSEIVSFLFAALSPMLAAYRDCTREVIARRICRFRVKIRGIMTLIDGSSICGVLVGVDAGSSVFYTAWNFRTLYDNENNTASLDAPSR